MFRNLGLILVLVAISTAASRRRPSNPDLGQDQEKYNSLYSQIFGSSFYGSQNYDTKYRPPSVNEDGYEPDPTLVQISLRNLEVTKFNETEKTLTFDADLLREYSDNRLVYDAPQDLKYVLSESYSLWTPGLTFSKNTEVSQKWQTFSSSSSETMISPDGQVLLRNPVTITVKTEDESSPLAEKEFSIEISSDKWTTEEVELAWSKVDPVEVSENLKVNGILGTYKLTPTLNTCKRTENLGSFVGTREFSCIQLNIKLVMQAEKLYHIRI